MSYIANKPQQKPQTQIIETQTAVVAASGTTSDAIDVWGCRVVNLSVPASLTSTALTFQVSDDDVTYYQVRNSDNTAYTITVSSSAASYELPVNRFAGYRYLKVVCGSAEASQRTFKIHPYLV